MLSPPCRWCWTRAGRGKYSYKQLMMALKEAKVAGHWLESSPDIRALLSALAVRLQEQGRDFRKVLFATLSLTACLHCCNSLICCCDEGHC